MALTLDPRFHEEFARISQVSGVNQPFVDWCVTQEFFDSSDIAAACSKEDDVPTKLTGVISGNDAWAYRFNGAVVKVWWAS